MNIIERMMGPSAIDGFLATHWPDKVHVVDGDLKRLGELGELAELHDLAALLTLISDPVDLLYPGGLRISTTRALDALPAYRAGGAMVYIKNMEKLPPIALACDELSALLRIPRHFVSCEGFAAQAGVVVAPHFDHETNFMIQVRGDKTWSWSANEDLPHPLYPFFPNNPNRFYKAGRHPYSGKPLSTDMPASKQVRRVGPGTVTFMPRGFWHSTVAHEESFSIGFVINPPTIADLAASAMLEQLHALESLRAHPLSLGKGREHTVSSVEQALSQAAAIASSMSATVLLDRYERSTKGNARTLLAY